VVCNIGNAAIHFFSVDNNKLALDYRSNSAKETLQPEDSRLLGILQ
jgi:hypothetical protein